MTVMSRQEVRNLFSEAAGDAGKGLRVFNGRHIDSIQDNVPAAIISFDTIGVARDLTGGFIYDGAVIVLIVVDGNHDLLDTYLDPVIAATYAVWNAQVPTANCSLAEIAYVDEVDPGYSAAQLSWVVQFNG